MDYREQIEDVLDIYKGIPLSDEVSIAIQEKGELKGFLIPVGIDYKKRYPQFIDLVYKWREENPIGFANRFKGSREKTENWFDNVLLPRKDRILFFVSTIQGQLIGHLGYSNFNYEKQSAEIDNVVRGVKGAEKGLMTKAMQTILLWGKKKLRLKEITLRVLDDNPHAVTFYERIGFKEINRIPLYRIEHDGMIEWLDLDEHEERKPEKHFIVMQLCQ